jgi:hypothetical protein
MTMNALQVQARIKKYRKQARDEPRECYIPECGKRAIWSHLLQKNGMLSELADQKGDIVELSSYDPFRTGRPGNYYFERIHKRHAFTFQGFCNEHDTSLFRALETPGADITAGDAPMRLSYRGFLNEIQKMENHVSSYRRIFGDSDLLDGMARHEPQQLAWFREIDRKFRLMITLFQRVKRAFEQEIRLPLVGTFAPALHEAAEFRFRCFSMKRVPICASSCFGMVAVADAEVIRQIDAGVDSGYDPETYFVTIAPSPAGRTTVVLGSRLNHEPAYGPMDNEAQKRELVSELIIRWFETWAVAPSWYDSYIKPHETRVLVERKRFASPAHKLMTLPKFNIFHLNKLKSVSLETSLLTRR